MFANQQCDYPNFVSFKSKRDCWALNKVETSPPIHPQVKTHFPGSQQGGCKCCETPNGLPLPIASKVTCFELKIIIVKWIPITKLT